jgi:hypothetical protein
MLKNKVIFLFLLAVAALCFNVLYHHTRFENEEEKRMQLKGCLHPLKDTDFSFLFCELQNKRIVVLGEQFHDDGSSFLIKEKIIRYLHENLNYNVVLYEAGLYDMWCMANDADSLNPATGLYSFWWNNSETKNLWDYYRNENSSKDSIHLGGFDVQLTGNMGDSIRIGKLADYLVRNGVRLDDYSYFLHFSKDMERYLAFWQVFKKQFTQVQKDSIVMELNAIAANIQRIPNPSMEDQIYYRYISGLKQRFESISNHRNAGDPERMYIRDSLMANNLIWLADSVYLNKKIIVWTANIHAIHPADSALYFNWRTTGQYLKNHYKGSLYTVVISSFGRLNAGGGLYRMMGNKSLEYLLHTFEVPYAYIKSEEIGRESFLKDEFISGINHGVNMKADWFSMFDLYIYIDKMKLITPIKE